MIWSPPCQSLMDWSQTCLITVTCFLIWIHSWTWPPFLVHQLCSIQWDGSLVREVLAVLTLSLKEQSSLVAPWQIKDISIYFTAARITSEWMQTLKSNSIFSPSIFVVLVHFIIDLCRRGKQTKCTDYMFCCLLLQHILKGMFCLKIEVWNITYYSFLW